MPIVPGSVMMIDPTSSEAIDSSRYSIDAVNATLVWRAPPALDSIKVSYRTFAINLNKPLFRKDISKVEQTEEFLLDPFAYKPSEGKGLSAIDLGDLDYNGSFSRGVSFGNSQNVVLNSSFNLQVSGFITKDIEITAALTDNNIPVQPDGSTQQLQEFDRVYIQIEKKPHKLIVGDYEIAGNKGHFMRFYKNLQGGSYSGRFNIKDSLKLSTSASLAIAKGRFSRNVLNIIEGNQGPYKLTGANGETFIIILSGTERVFVNGRQLERGAENDYIMDYNLGEISFTPNVIMTQDLRVIVEFEYSEQNYFRSLAHTYNEFGNDKFKVKLGFYSEQDSKNQPLQADLTTEQKRFLTEAGETLTEAQFPGFRQTTFDANRVLYQMKDTLVNGTLYDTIFEYSTNPELAIYSLTFSYTGPGAGNYIPTATTANGRVFSWIAPINGIPQGTYEPIITLVTPKRRQMTTLGFELNPTTNDHIYAEGALTNNDLNTFSEIGNNDNVGVASLVGYKRTTNLGRKAIITQYDADSNVIGTYTERKWFLETDLSYEFVNHNFEVIERYRPVEFERNWNFNNAAAPEGDQHLAHGEITLNRNHWGNISYGYNKFRIGPFYNGDIHTVGAHFNKHGYKLDFNASFLNSQATDKDTRFIRPFLTAEKAFHKLKGWRIGGIYEHDNNKISAPGTDSLLVGSFVFTDWRVYIASPENDSVRNKLKLEYIRRLEWRPLYNEPDLSLFTISNTWNLTGAWLSNKYQSLHWNLTYRRFDNMDTTSTLNSTELAEFYLGRIQYDLTVLKGAIQTSILYELGTGQEQRRDYTYLPVNSGEGTYIWIDYNDNGLQETNEFELAAFQEDTMYIRVLNPTNEFDPVNTTILNQVLNLTPAAAIKKRSGFLGFVARFNTITSFQIDRKVFRNSGASPFDPFAVDIDNDDLIAANTIIRNTVFFNRTDTRFSLEYTIQDNSQKNNLTNGFESRKQREHLFRPRIKLFKTVNLITRYAFGFRSSNNEVFIERNYHINYQELEPELSYLWKNKWRLSLSYLLRIGDDVAPGASNYALTHQATLDTRLSIVTKTNISAKFSYATIKYDGIENGPVEFAMLQGLQPGDNYLWEFNFNRTLAKNIQLILGYEGRKTGTADMVHIGRAQVRAVF